ncbi:MAG TPA: 4-vinyl reductase [Gemmatimonadaceae bacterium]
MELVNNGMLGLPRPALAALRAALYRDAGAAAAGYLQEAGYAGGETLFASFRGWLTARKEPAPESLPLERFGELATAFFREAGWGSVAIGSLRNAVATLDSRDWGEADPESGMDHPACHFTTGMFADFFGRIADAPLAVLEVECRSAGASRCRFLVGNAEVMEHVYETMGRGEGYEVALGEVE